MEQMRQRLGPEQALNAKLRSLALFCNTVRAVEAPEQGRVVVCVKFPLRSGSSEEHWEN